MASLPPVSREQAFLETYFQCLAQFAYDKAKDSCVSTKGLVINYGEGGLQNGKIVGPNLFARPHI